MSEKLLQLDVVSPEGEVYSGKVCRVTAKGTEGEIGIEPGHAQLLTSLAPSTLRIELTSGKEELLYVCGGTLEIQPDHVIVLADTVERPQDVNEAEAKRAQEHARKLLANKGDIDYQQTYQELNEALAKIRLLELVRNQKMGR